MRFYEAVFYVNPGILYKTVHDLSEHTFGLFTSTVYIIFIFLSASDSVVTLATSCRFIRWILFLDILFISGHKILTLPSYRLKEYNRCGYSKNIESWIYFSGTSVLNRSNKASILPNTVFLQNKVCFSIGMNMEQQLLLVFFHK